MNNGDMPAMPQDYVLWCEGIVKCPTEGIGLTKREMFAMHAMQGLLSNGDRWLGDENNCSQTAIKFADALLSQLQEEKG